MIKNKEKNFVSAVVYLHNSESFVGEFIEKISKTLEENFLSFELICVDDGSTDNTVSVVKNIAEKRDKGTVSIIKLSNYQGYEAAMNAGVDLAIGDYVFEFDSAFIDYDISLMMKLYLKSLEGYDVVSATNNKYKKGSSKLFYALFNKSANLQYKIKSESFRIVSRRAINKVYSMSKSVKYRKAFYANCGLKSANIEYDGTQKPTGVTAVERDYRTETAATSLILFTDVAYKASIGISVLMMIATVFMAIYSIITFATNNAIEGFTTTMLVVTGSFFAVFVLFAIVIKYLSILVQLVFNRQEYKIESIEKISK